MNIVKKVYCRIFQKVFHISLPFLPYREPEILNSQKEIPSVLFAEKKVHPLIVTDIGLDKLGIAEKLKVILEDAGIQYSYFSDVIANPTTDTVSMAVSMYKNDNCDCFISIGGGSSIDTAKAAAILIAKPKKTLGQVKGILKVHKKLPLHIAIPTTAGTGSETTLASVIVDAKTRHKYAINDFPLIPNYAVLSASLTVSLPPYITATTGLDALTHAVEAYIGNSTIKRTREAAKGAVRLIFRYLKRAYDNGSDKEARHNMLKASYLAGIAFTRSYVGYVHAIAHSLGGQYNVAHGKANAVILPVMLEAYGSSIHSKLRKLAIAAELAPASVSDSEGARIFIEKLKELEKSMGIETTISEIKEADIPLLARHADKEANPLYPVPVLMNAKELELYYYSLMGDQNDSTADQGT